MSGIWPLLAPVLTVIIALLSKNVLLALFAGICYLSVLLNGVNFLMPMADYLIGGVTSNGTTLMPLIPLGIMLWFIRRAGGFKAFAAWSHKKVKDRRQAGGLVFLISCILSAANDLLANVTVGQIVRPVITQKKVSRHKSAFISASTAPNVASFLPFQTYFLFCVGMLGSLLPPEVSPIPFFFLGIPLSFYTLLAILFALLMALDILPQVGPLKRFQRLADEAADCRIGDAVVCQEGSRYGGVRKKSHGLVAAQEHFTSGYEFIQK